MKSGRLFTFYPPAPDRRSAGRLLLACCFLLLLPALRDLSFAGDTSGAKLTFSTISLEEGLSQSIVKCIAQDRWGFMWFGTEDGLNKFDGYRFTVLKNAPDDPNSIAYNDINALHADKYGNLWIGTFYGGLDKYDQNREKFIHFKSDPADPNSLSNDNIHVIFEDRSGILWVGTEAGLNRLAVVPGDSLPRITRFVHDPDNPRSLSHNTVRAVCQDSAGTLWVGTDAGLNRFRPSSGDFVRYTHRPADPASLSDNTVLALTTGRTGELWIGTGAGGLNRLENGKTGAVKFIRYPYPPAGADNPGCNRVNRIFEDRNGGLWVGTHGGGLCRLEPGTAAFTCYRNNPQDRTSIGYDEIMDIYEDSSGLIWIGTYGGGISKIDPARRQFRLFRPESGNPNSLSHPIVWCIHQDRQGDLWIGTHGGGLDRLNRRTGRFTHYRNDPADPHSLSADIVRLVFEDRDGTLWIGTHGGGLNRFGRETGRFTAFRHDPENPRSLSHDELRSICQDRQGTLWIGTNGGGLNRMLPGPDPGSPPGFIRYRYSAADAHSLSNDFVRVIYEDRDGDFWIGTQGGGLNRLDRRSGRFSRIRAVPEMPDSLNNDYVFSIYEDDDGILWLGTWGGGLNRFDKRRHTFRAFTTADGLPSNAIYGILADEAGNLWMSTNNGLCRFNPGSGECRNFSAADGLQDNEFNGGAYSRSPQGEMFFGGIHGFNAFFPAEISDNPFIPPVVITALQIMNKPVKLGQPLSEIRELVLSHRDYVFSLEFAALDFTAPEKNAYAFMMQGLDKDWITTGADKRFATYTTLPPGRYTFRVKGSNNDGVWNEAGASLRIIITPPFWRRWWFLLVAAAAILSLTHIAYRRRLRNVRLKTELQTAHSAQMSIMPQADPRVDGLEISGVCLPASEVGGDFFDYLWFDADGTRFGIVIGDVSGKAMGSAMTAVMTSGMVCSHIRQDLSVSEILTRLNRPLLSKTNRNMFIALCLAAIRLPDRTLTFANAGLDRPLLKSGDHLEFLQSAGPRYPLGSRPATLYREQQRQLTPGDVLIFNTDGLTEARNSRGNMFGEEHLLHLLGEMDTARLSAAEIKTAVVNAAGRFTGKAPQHDDMTVVVVKVK